MYRLYGKVANKTLLDISQNEGDIIGTMYEYLEKGLIIPFIITKQEGQKEIEYKKFII